MKVIGHDGSARETLVRHAFKCITETCAWCGSKNARGELYMYAVVPDDSNKRHWLKGCFCSVSCMRAYHA